jgi:hypothetical protein
MSSRFNLSNVDAEKAFSRQKKPSAVSSEFSPVASNAFSTRRNEPKNEPSVFGKSGGDFVKESVFGRKKEQYKQETVPPIVLQSEPKETVELGEHERNPEVLLSDELFPVLASPKKSFVESPKKSATGSPKHSFVDLIKKRKNKEEIEERERQEKLHEETEKQRRKKEEMEMRKQSVVKSYLMPSMRRDVYNDDDSAYDE